MRVAFLGATEIAVSTAELLIQRGHEVIIIELDPERIEALEERLDCAFLNGDGTKPEVLREVNPEATEVLFCLTDYDQTNIIASLVGRSLGFDRVITKIIDQEYEVICRELGLEDTIIPSRTIARYLADMLRGEDVLELSTVFKDEARLFAFLAGEDESGPVADLGLPDQAKVICYFREGTFHLADGDSDIHPGDEVVILTHSENLPQLQERWQQAKDQQS